MNTGAQPDPKDPHGPWIIPDEQFSDDVQLLISRGHQDLSVTPWENTPREEALRRTAVHILANHFRNDAPTTVAPVSMPITSVPSIQPHTPENTEYEDTDDQMFSDM